MNRKKKILSLAVCCALLLSGCQGANVSSPAQSETPTAGTQSAEESTAAPDTAEEPSEISESTDSSEQEEESETSAEETQDSKPDTAAGITAVGAKGIDTSLDCYFRTENNGKRIACELIEETIDFRDMDRYIFGYALDDSTCSVSEGESGKDILTISSDACDIYVRASTCSYSESEENDIKTRIGAELSVNAKEFPSAYTLTWDDPVVSAFPVQSENDFTEKYGAYGYENVEAYKYSEADNITFGYRIAEPVKVNAFVCGSDEGVSVLVDPEYMYGLPMFRDSQYRFRFGEDLVYADSLLFEGSTAEGLSLDAPAYAYAQVTLSDIHVSRDRRKGMTAVCTVNDIDIIDRFDDIKEYDISSDDHVIAGLDKDPEMKEVYDAVMNAKSDIYKEDTYGIVLLDLDFDGKPEVLVSRLDSSGESNYDWKLDTDVYRVSDGALRFIDTMPLCYRVVYYEGAFLGLTELPDGTQGWFATTRGDEDYIFTLDGDTLTAHPLFTRKAAGDDPIVLNGEAEQTDYFFMGERMIPEIVMKEEPYSETGELNFETPLWNGVSGYFGMWELFGFARADYCEKNIKKSFYLHSAWLMNDSADDAREKPFLYELSDREFSHKIAYLTDDFYYGGAISSQHKYWFLGDYAKPVIYLYPEEETDVSVRIGLPGDGELSCTYPEYNDGWNVTAEPDGTLYDENGDEYYCLYWEGSGSALLDAGEGFCVAGEDTAEFLREKLMYIGLTAREANEFIVYWLPKMQDAPYNVITLHTEDYNTAIPLYVSPKPDSVIRVFMTYLPCDEYTDIPAQELPRYERNGFTLVEWGGAAAE